MIVNPTFQLDFFRAPFAAENGFPGLVHGIHAWISCSPLSQRRVGAGIEVTKYPLNVPLITTRVELYRIGRLVVDYINREMARSAHSIRVFERSEIARAIQIDAASVGQVLKCFEGSENDITIFKKPAT